MRITTPPLPVEDCLPGLLQALETKGLAVLQAPPGAGKTTRVPLALLEAVHTGRLGGPGILMLEPRRLAARAAARRLAWHLGEKPGHTIGLTTRLDRVGGPDTRVEVVTEGILTRRLQRDPALQDIGIVIFDEFHERSLQADLGLALCLHARQLLRPDLGILVMSATLDTAGVAALLGGAPVIESRGRSFPVDIRYGGPAPDARSIAAPVTQAVRAALTEQSGSILVFLPGQREIEATARALEAQADSSTHILPLYGQLAPEAQDAAIRPAPPGQRKVVLATDIAETSLTIEGIRVVVDAGFARKPVFDPRTGLTRLETVPISRASADQRCGRAGRLEPGVCIRLWSEEAHARLPARTTPEILSADLAPLALTLACWGADADELAWLDPPPAAALSQAHDLLRDLGALDAAGRPTAHGRALEALGTHPRLAHMLLRARDLGLGRTACVLTALLEERDPLPAGAGADLRLRMRLAAGDRSGPGVAQGALRRIRTLAARRAGQLELDPREAVDADSTGLLLALAYPDRIALRREGIDGRFLLSGGRGARMREGEDLQACECLVAAVLDDTGRDALIRLAAPLERSRLEDELAGSITEEDILAWDESIQGVVAQRARRLGALRLGSRPLQAADPQAVTDLLVQAIHDRGLRCLPWAPDSERLRQRMAFARVLEPEGGWPDVSNEALLNGLADWLGPSMAGMSRLDHLARLDLVAALQGLLDWRQLKRLDAIAPTHLTVPSGSRLRIDYSDPHAPVLAVRIQEIFGLMETPRVGDGRVPLTLHLLSPARRPVQVTRDLAGFWARTYAEVKKDLKGRYPKHHWPDDPVGKG
ncbi:ATP-dependent helicase HrpB [Thioalkalivibrio denitrificans]|uniref:ATP-dependent helicase HrpB n=1 Tax=Thioalkalivibrio denitrificans TaxID=108003 RepID=A0A1V3NV99_9GAMM|nr:ATP-dependent helicase HrpB [Thioalkalivibrio denitrificans]OOG28732.1 ATP-dependent helicase HrpB [Thioalkalivibrio denitrificans]